MTPTGWLNTVPISVIDRDVVFRHAQCQLFVQFCGGGGERGVPYWAWTISFYQSPSSWAGWGTGSCYWNFILIITIFQCKLFSNFSRKHLVTRILIFLLFPCLGVLYQSEFALGTWYSYYIIWYW